MASLLKSLPLIALFFFCFNFNVQGALLSEKKVGKVVNKGLRREFRWGQSCFNEGEKKIFKSLKDAEEYLQCLYKEREVLVGDFYGINITAYRYVNIFYPMGYIGQRIKKIDDEIEKTKSIIKTLKREKDLILGR